MRRFGVRQSSGEVTKLRPIDDYSECKVNQAFGYCDKVDLRAMDELVWILRASTFWLLGNESCVVKLSNGTVLSGPVHPSWKNCDVDPVCRRLICMLPTSSSRFPLARGLSLWWC